MIRFIETIKFNPSFISQVYKLFYNPDKGKCDLYWRKKFKLIKGWPEGLDTENLEIVSIGTDYITYWAGGDWQEGATVNLQLDTNTNKLEWIPFEAFHKKSAIEIKNAIADLNEQGRILSESDQNENCQIAGSMMGDLPQNITNTLSLGYKNGRILPIPQKRANSNDYDYITYF